MITHILHHHVRCQKRKKLRIKTRIKTRKQQVSEEHQRDTKVQQTSQNLQNSNNTRQQNVQSVLKRS